MPYWKNVPSVINPEEERLLMSENGEEEEDKYLQLVSKTKSDKTKSENCNKEEEETSENRSFLDKIKAIPHSGYLLMFIAALMNAGVGLIVKELDSVAPLLLLLSRSVVICFVTSPYIIWNKLAVFPNGRLTALTVRAISLALFLCSQFYGFRLLPLGDVRTLSAAMIAFVSLLACFVFCWGCGAAPRPPWPPAPMP